LKELTIILRKDIFPGSISGIGEIQGMGSKIDAKCGQLSALLYLQQRILKG